ncbi:MAG: 30S ribosomal protein S18 [Candidatus Roizmanbacteria bacterium]|nr:MAG: 30S ribosomal protein S18 [Candidatus Roizmanbacteria bacterium]
MNKCFFHRYNTYPNYKDVENLEKFLSPRKKILSREKTGVCAKHQRQLTKHIKYARFLALLPFVSYHGVR